VDQIKWLRKVGGIMLQVQNKNIFVIHVLNGMYMMMVSKE